jgi:hypothetical protein
MASTLPAAYMDLTPNLNLAPNGASLTLTSTRPRRALCCLLALSLGLGGASSVVKSVATCCSALSLSGLVQTATPLTTQLGGVPQ